MFRTLSRFFFPNPLDRLLEKTKKKGGKKILLGWNRGLGDIALGLFAIVKRIRDFIPDAEITFLIRNNLKDGFTMLEGVKTVVAPKWKRGLSYNVFTTLKELEIDPKQFDLIIEKPSPTDWVSWQKGNLVPRLKWDLKHDLLSNKFPFPEGFTYIGVQAVTETNYGHWRNWPIERWNALFDLLSARENVKILLFGFAPEPKFSQKNLIDLRGKTTLFELLALIKNRCHGLVLPDSGILSFAYYLDVDFPLKVVSLWADPNHGILKQAVGSPNQRLSHFPLIGEKRDLSSLRPEKVLNALFPVRPLEKCPSYEEVTSGSLQNTAAILLAGGQGSRLNSKGPKGTFHILGKSLFEWIIEKTPKENFPIAVMTSEQNHEETVAFFENHRYFGREIYLFPQTSKPLLDQNRKPLNMTAPDGNGAVFESFKRSPLASLFQRRGIELLTICPIENPLANPADLKLIGCHRNTKADITIKCLERLASDTKKGALVEREGKIEILEYLYLDPSQKYFYSNSGMMAMSLPFFLKMGETQLPTHYVEKKLPGTNTYVFKEERFIFESLPYAAHVSAFSCPRNRCYAPMKSLENLPQVEHILSQKDETL